MVDAAFLDQLTADADRDGIEKRIVGAVIEHDGEVLLLKRPADDFMGGIWELPSGNVEADETLDVALHREVTEETGLDITSIGEYIGCFDYLSGSGKQSRQFNFAVDVASPQPVQLQEHAAYQWTPLTEELPTTNAVKGVLATYRELRRV